MSQYDFVVVGAGLFGCAFAHTAKNAGASVLVIDKRNHIAGNAHDVEVDGVLHHVYGPHIFHTHDVRLWNWMSQFCELRHIHHTVRANFHGRIFSFPINLLTMSQLWGVSTPQQAMKKLDSVRIKDVDPNANAKNRILHHAGEEIYKTFFEGYTRKQWGLDPSEVPAEVVKRVPIRFDYNDSYYNDQYVGMPVGGYTKACANMLSGCDVELNADFMEDTARFSQLGRVVFSGSLDRLCGYCFGKLPYRSLRFERRPSYSANAQGGSVVNYTSDSVPFTRSVEYAHLDGAKVSNSHLVYEFPQAFEGDAEPFYPINNIANDSIQKQYEEVAEETFAGIITGGRMGSYRYYDMHQAIAMGISRANKIMKGDRQ